MSQLSLSLCAHKIVFTLEGYFARSDGHNLFEFLPVFLVGLGN